MHKEEAPGSAFWGSLQLIDTGDPNVDLVMVGQKSSHSQTHTHPHPTLQCALTLMLFPSLAGVDRRWNPDILFLCHLPGGHDLTGKLQQVQV